MAFEKGSGRGLLLKGPLQLSWRCTPTRSNLIFSRSPKQQFTPKYERDKVPRTHELIYVNNMNYYYFWSQLFVYMLSVPACCWCVYIIVQNRHNFKQEIEKHGFLESKAVAILYLLFGGFMIVFTNLACRRAVFRMYYHSDTDKFIAIVQRWYMSRTQLHFSAEDCKPRPKALAGVRGNIYIKGHCFLITDTDFKKPMYYNKLMGWERGQEDILDKINDRII